MSVIVHLLTLLKTPGCSRKKAGKIIPLLRQHKPSGIQDLRDVLLASGLNSDEIPSIDELSASYRQAMDLLERTDKMGITVIWADSVYYPKLLQGIGDPPVLLFVKGNPGCLVSGRTCAVIGTKEPSPYGLKCAHRLGAMLARKDFVVVSGLARWLRYGCASRLRARRGPYRCRIGTWP